MTQPIDEPAPGEPLQAEPAPPADEPPSEAGSAPREPDPATSMPEPWPSEDAPPDIPMAPGEPAMALPDASGDPAADVLTPGWIPPEGGGTRGRGFTCCLVLAVVGVVVAFLSVGSVVALVFLGSQAQAILRGTVEFEASTVVGCYVQSPETTFPASATIHFAAHFQRDVKAGEAITVAVTYPDGATETNNTTYDKGGDCVNDSIAPGLPVGSYVLQFRSGTEALATGGFTITP